MVFLFKMNNSCVIWKHRLLLNLSTSLAQVCPSWLSEGEIRPADCNLAAVGCSWSQETVGFASHSWYLIVYQGLTGTKHTCYWYFVFVFVFVFVCFFGHMNRHLRHEGRERCNRRMQKHHTAQHAGKCCKEADALVYMERRESSKRQSKPGYPGSR